MKTARGYIVASGDVITLWVMTVSEVQKKRRGKWETDVVYEVHGLTEDDDFDRIAHEFAHCILEHEYMEVQTETALYRLWKTEDVCES